MSTDQENNEKHEPKIIMSNGIGTTFDQLPQRKRIMQPKSSQKVMFGMLASSAILIAVVLLAVLLTIIINGLRGFNFKLIFLSPRNYRYSYRPAIFGTILIIFGAVAIALPLGLAAAIYLTEYAKKGFIINMINQGISNLAAVPSIVFGVFGYAFFTLALGMNKSLYAGWFTLACMILPTIIRTSEEALKNVPNSYREGSYALGVTKWRTIRYIVLPAALPGISTGVILSLGRAAGETAAIMFVGGAIVPGFISFGSKFGALPIQLYLMAISAPSDTRYIQWSIALVLVLIVFGFNLAAIIIRNRSEKKQGRI